MLRQLLENFARTVRVMNCVKCVKRKMMTFGFHTFDKKPCKNVCFVDRDYVVVVLLALQVRILRRVQ